ncbi:MAG TPA: Rrf2 family transcriptional regulator [Steroidobacteraceae bacterium]|nr:Rrf2 family transcriptional regulator [Steroidobacteraceae bacterium]
MHLTTYTDYSLRVLIRLALRPGELATIAGIARSYDISEHHLMKVVHQLGVAGYIDTVRGHGGGIRLAREPAKINLGEVVRRSEPDFALAECFRASGRCGIQPSCVLSGILGEALTAFLAVLDRYTLADLLGEPERLARLLKVSSARSPAVKSERSRTARH